jgi:hypothetical protein
MKKLLGCVAAVLISTAAAADAPSQREAPRIVNHNGSLMQVIVLPGDMVDIVYMNVRPALWGYVSPGQVFIHGQWREGILYATAYSGSRCGMVPYQVSGKVELNGVLVLRGPAPLIDPWTCGVIQWIWSPTNSTLVFYPA